MIDRDQGRRSAARTKVVALTWVHSGTGVKLPLAAIAALAARPQPAAGRGRRRPRPRPSSTTRSASTCCDVFVAGTHKWLGGPRGTGIVWSIKAGTMAGDPELRGDDPGAFDDRRSTDPGGAAFTPGGYHSFEHRWALAEAFDWQATLGRAAVAERIPRAASG